MGKDYRSYFRMNPTEVCPNRAFSDLQKEREIVEVICGRPSESKVEKDALEWLLTQDEEYSEYFMRGSALKALKSAVEGLLPMPISEEILPHLAALRSKPERPRRSRRARYGAQERDKSPKRK